MAVVIRQLGPYIAAALALLALTFVVPGVNPYRPPLMDLTGSVAIAAY